MTSKTPGRLPQLFAAAGITVLAACVFNVTVVTQTVHGTFDVDPDQWHTVDIAGRDLSSPLAVTGTANSFMDVTAVVSAWAPPESGGDLLADVALTFVEREGVVELDTQYDGPLVELLSFDSLAFEIPRRIHVNADIGSAGAALGDLDGDVDLTAKGGNLIVNTTGDVTVETKDGEVTVDSKSATLAGEDADFTVRVDEGITLTMEGGTATLTFGSDGQIKGEGARITARVTGDGGSVQITTTTGDITVRVPVGAGFAVEITGTRGDVTVDADTVEGDITRTEDEIEQDGSTHIVTRESFEGTVNGGGSGSILISTEMGDVTVGQFTP